MIILDVNVLVVGNRADLPAHERVKAWLEGVLNGPQTVGLPSLSLIGYLRLVTNHRVFVQPTTLPEALEFCDALVAAPAVRRLAAGRGHWPQLRQLIHDLSLRGNDMPDAYLAALALENDAVLATSDRGFARFPGLTLLDPATA